MSRLHIDSVTKSFGSKKILQDIYLSCETGKITGLLGRNGEGKSTLLQIIFGTVKGDTQFIRFDHSILNTLFDRKNRITYLPQQSFLPKNTKVKSLISLFCDKKNAEELFSLVLIQPFLNETAKNLSHGEKRLIEILLVIYSNSDFSLLDEPFYGLSPKFIEEVKFLIQQQSKRKGFIISDLQYHYVLSISNDIYLLSDTHLKLIKDDKNYNF